MENLLNIQPDTAFLLLLIAGFLLCMVLPVEFSFDEERSFQEGDDWFL